MSSPRAYLLFGTGPTARQGLLEAFGRWFPNALYRDVSELPYHDIGRVYRQLVSSGYQPTVLVSEETLPLTLTEDWVRSQTIFGQIQAQTEMPVYLVNVRRPSSFVRIVRMVEDSGAMKTPKEPTEVDRLKVKQKQEVIMLKKQQADELLNAQERELEKKERDDMAKIENGTKQRDITR